MAGVIRKVLFGLVLEDAVIREENAYRFYESAREKVSAEEAKVLLKKLCTEELRHRLKLEELQRRGVSEELEFSSPAEIELLEEDEQSWPEIHARSSVSDILKLALVKEKQAASYYRLIAGRSLLRTVRDLFLLLAGEEGEHVRWVEKMLADL
ncbi:MAG: ferritin family protein [Spirochaetaceae bacterium]|nr:MAG: ferritin family protein [Spirochaetaceae bacterium]